MGSRHSQQTAWAKGAIDGTLGEELPGRATGFAAPLTAADMRGMYARNRSPEVRELLWEIARLHTRLRRAAQLASCFPLYGSWATSSSFAIILEAMRRELAEEPCLRDAGTPASTDEEELVAAPYWAAKRAARRRRNA